ncbi:hypothetical protein JOB18_018803 [Solea senegalensis]|uniref:Uncharacterized protein n=1 Tax=Solea senegalensis TaxID=28829 RepID=A0AAV6PQ85_SOLSE|nr:hypothetical protein JOB18_018803 [Solea senegalensis]
MATTDFRDKGNYSERFSVAPVFCLFCSFPVWPAPTLVLLDCLSGPLVFRSGLTIARLSICYWTETEMG